MNHSHPHDTIRFKPEHIENIACMDDFYRATYLTGLLESGWIKDVQQLWMNDKQADMVAELCKQNIRKIKKYKHYSPHDLDLAVAMDWLNYCPVSVPYVPENEIWIWSTENYKEAMEEYRLWLRETPREEI